MKLLKIMDTTPIKTGSKKHKQNNGESLANLTGHVYKHKKIVSLAHKINGYWFVLPIKMWSEWFSINYTTILYRKNHGRTAEECLKTVPFNYHRLTKSTKYW